MDLQKPLEDNEFLQMIKLIKRYSNSQLDQFDNWVIDSDKGDVFISLSLSSSGPESAYDLSLIHI